MRYLLVILTFVLLAPVQAEAQSAADVISEMIERHEQQFQHIDDYTLVTNRYTAHYRRIPDTQSFETRTDWTGGGLMQGQAFGTQAYQQDTAQLQVLADHAEYVRQETVDGRPAHVLRIGGTTFMEAYAEEGQRADGEIGDVYFFIDAERYLPLRLEYNVVIDEYDDRRISPSINFLDYRQVEGMWVPYRTQMQMENLEAAMTPEEREELAQSLEEMERELREAGGLRRRIVERALGGRMERLREQLAEGMLSYSIEVEDVQVNTGLADDIFVVEQQN